ncbi:UPF0182 family protein [Bailinhaonella thermotolerans]|nr:UPF0182 family protein [Bailinhaonella thermotolerans]
MARRPRLLIPVAIALVAVVALFFVFAGIWTDWLWFESVNFSSVFSTMLLTQATLFVLGALLMVGIVGGNMLLAYRLRPMFAMSMFGGQQGVERYRLAVDPHRKLIFLIAMGVLALFTGSSTSGQWKTWLQFVNRTPFGEKDAQFGLDVSFFAFTYPFIRLVLGFLFAAVVLAAIAATVVHYLYGGFRLQSPGGLRATRGARAHLAVLLGVFVLLKGVAYWVDRYGLAFSDRGFVEGPSYTDITAVLPAKAILASIAVICAALFFAAVVRPGGMLPGVGFGLLVLSAILIGGVYPALVEQFQVKPNQQGKEAPYIAKNIQATRKAYGVDKAEVTNYDAKITASSQELANEAATISGVRLLDPALLARTYQQLQQIRGFYQFPDQLDIDRYPDATGAIRDTVVAVREISGPPAQQDNWINRHLVYTHGYGFVAAPGNKVDQYGLPAFEAGDMPPTGDLVKQTGLKEPRVYFGENSPVYSIVGGPKGGKSIELDYPETGGSGQQNTTYAGNGGVPMGSFFNRLLFAAKFGEKNLLLSGDINEKSQILYTRNPRERINKVAPFLTLDGDPYPAIVGGRIVWIVDGYTTSDGYPYSQSRSLQDATRDTATETGGLARQPRDRINYIRNSVKATVDAYNGTVTLYEWGKKDPVLQTWMKAFPGVVKPESAISPELRQHLRYPNDLFKVQRDVLSKYHVTDPDAFYGGQDFWNIPNDPTERGNMRQPPYYLSLKMPGDSAPSFSLTTAFVPQKRPNMAAFMAVDATPGASYGRLRILQLPGNTAIQGPGQAQNTINADPKVSTELNLLRGSPGTNSATQVLNGNLLTLPFGNGLLYVQPVYVQAAPREGQEPYPILKKVALMFGNKVGFGDTLGDALKQVFGDAPVTPEGDRPPPGQQQPGETSTLTPGVLSAIEAAQKAFQAGEDALAKKDLAGYAKAQADLKAALKRLEEERDKARTPAPASTGTPAPTPAGTPAPTPSPNG